jgi:hypothetical protein
MYITTFTSFWKFKIIWTKKKLNIIIQQHFNDHSFEFFLINGFFLNIIILPILSYFQLLYDYFSLIQIISPYIIYDYLWLFSITFGYFWLFHLSAIGGY